MTEHIEPFEAEEELVEQLLDGMVEMIRIDPERALRMTREALRRSRRIGNRELTAFSHLKIAECRMARGHYDEALRSARRAEAIVAEGGLTPQADLILYRTLAHIHAARAEYHRAIEMFERSLEISRATDDLPGMAPALSSMGSCYRAIGEYAKAIGLLGEAHRIFEETGFVMGAAVALNNMAAVYFEVGDLAGALELYERCLAIHVETGAKVGEAKVLARIGSIHVQRGNFEPGLEHLERSLERSAGLGLEQSVAAALVWIGDALVEMGRGDEALERLERAATLNRERIADRALELKIEMVMGKLHAARGLHREALRHYGEAMRLARESESRRSEADLALLMAAAHEAMGSLPRALDHYRLHLSIRDEIDKQEALQAIERMRSRLEIERMEREQEALRRRSEQLERERDVKEQELAAISLHLVRKSAFLDQLKSKVKLLAAHPAPETRRLARGILNDLAVQAADGENWSRFERQLEALHPAYLRSLTAQCPELTPAEIRVCCLLRLNLPTKDIAAILGTSIRTIESHRRYIRRKLRLDAGTSLALHLAAL